MIGMHGSHNVNGNVMKYRPATSDSEIDDWLDIENVDEDGDAEDFMQSAWMDGFLYGVISVIGLVTTAILVAEALP